MKDNPWKKDIHSLDSMGGQMGMKMSRILKKSIQRKWIDNIIFPLILLLYPLRHVMVGVEWWDTGYNYGNFVYMDRIDPMWVFGTYLANALGRFMTGLPFGDRMLGLNVYTGLLVSLLALSGYYFFTRKLKIPSWIAFAGEVLAVSLCWCPTALLYNYLTYVLMGAGAMCLYMALTQDNAFKRKGFFVLAGVCLGVNVFVRFPNLAEMGLIVAAWAFGFIARKSTPWKEGFPGKKSYQWIRDYPWKEVAAQTGWCVLGYVLGMGVCLGYLCLRYGAGEYVSAIMRLLSMPAEASDYTIASMVEYQLRNYQQNFYWLLYLLVFTALGVAGFAVLPGKFMWLKRVGYVGCIFVGFYYLMQQNMFNMKYSTKLSVFQWAVFFLSATIIAGVVTIFRKEGAPAPVNGELPHSMEERHSRDKLWAGMSILIILITPLGSNNHLYSSMNNLFFVAPFTLWLLVRFLKWLPKNFPWKVGIYTFPIRAMIICMLLMLGIQSLGFGMVYVFSESDGGENLHTKMENNDILKGMYTDPERAEVLSSLSVYVEEEGLKGQEVILYGWIPSLSYYLQMPFAISSWPDLRSYNYEVMEEDLALLAGQIGRREREVPVVLLEVKYGTYLKGREAALMEAGLNDSEILNIAEDRKFTLLLDWMEQYGYEIAFENNKFVLLQAD